MDIKKMLGLIGCAAIVLIMIAFAAVWIGFHRGEEGNQQGGSIGGNCSILFPASAGTDEQIGKVLNAYIDKYAPANSPLRGTGVLFAKSGRGNVNPAIMVAIARKESSFGTAGGGVAKHNPFGRMDTNHILMSFNDWPDAIADQGPYMKRMYIDTGQKTISTMLNKYAPSSENDTTTYIKQVSDWTNEMARMGNGVVLGPECIEGALSTGKWIWPLDDHSRITSDYGAPRNGNTHKGIDIAAPKGTPIKAVSNGKVITVYTVCSQTVNSCTQDCCWGIYIEIDHGNGLVARYSHINPGSPRVSVGETVTQGQIIGETDNTGYSKGNHLDFEVKLNGRFVNPRNYLPNN